MLAPAEYAVQKLDSGWRPGVWSETVVRMSLHRRLVLQMLESRDMRIIEGMGVPCWDSGCLSEWRVKGRAGGDHHKVCEAFRTAYLVV